MSADEVIDVRAILGRLLARRWRIAISVGIFASIFLAVALLTTPVYRASTVLVPAAAERGPGALGAALGQLGGIAALAGINVGANDYETEEALAVLRSREFTERFIAQNNLIPKLFANRWSFFKTKKQPTPAKASKYFDRKIRSVARDRKTGLVTMHVDWADREEAAAWVNELVERLNEEMRVRAVTRANDHVAFLEKELKATTTVETREAIGRLMEAQIKQRMLANVSREYAFRVVDKAMAPDRTDPVSPKKLILLVIGVMIGLAVGVGWAFFPSVGEKPI